MRDENILVWLPSPLGDAVLCTPALRAIRRRFEGAKISFFCNTIVRDVLTPCSFNDNWIEQSSKNPFSIARELKQHNFSHAILFKNSFVTSLSVYMAGIPSRIGYAREGRGFMLTEKLYASKLSNGKFKPGSMVDYYLAIASRLEADTKDKELELSTDGQSLASLTTKLPEINQSKGPIIIMVPGGAFGPSKCWPSERFAQTADMLIDKYNATVVVSVAPNPAEKLIGNEILNLSKHKLFNLGERPVNLAELKVLFSKAELVITNDTGPRHIGIAMRRKVVTLFGPNDPAWTETNYVNEIKIIGKAACAPCQKPVCKKAEHECMMAITVDAVSDAARKLLSK